MSEASTVENGSSLKVEDFLSFWALVNALIRSASLLCFFVDFCFTCPDGFRGWNGTDTYGVDRSGLPGSAHPCIVSSSAAF